MQIIGGKFRSRRLQAPKGSTTRPTSGRLRATLFDICQSYIEGSSFLDVFAGGGAMGLEAISRGADKAVFVEKAKGAISCIRKNVQLLEAEKQVEILSGDVLDVLPRLEKQGRKFSIIYVDPPYEQMCRWKGNTLLYSEAVLKIIDEYDLLSPSGVLFLEEAKGQVFDEESLSSLVLLSSRNYGVSMLRQYQHHEEEKL
ncbi:MAG: 16S rRNA (guanine966-N2)-methyltransferase [Chlamydiales bacterium]|jgi:16S rRNA (guanine966-N2)-methyltransferase